MSPTVAQMLQAEQRLQKLGQELREARASSFTGGVDGMPLFFFLALSLSLSLSLFLSVHLQKRFPCVRFTRCAHC